MIVVDLFSISRNVTCLLLGYWLELKSIVVLDSAICNYAMRSQFNYILSCKELVHHNAVLLSDVRMLQWLYIKALRVATIVFCAKTERSHSLVEYFIAFGNSIRCAYFRRGCNEGDMMCLVACYCKHLAKLGCTHVSISYAFHIILLNNPNILELWIHKATVVVKI